MSSSKSNIRKCVVCTKSLEKEKLFRVLRDHQSSEYKINPSKYEFGRSFYFCKNQECILKIQKHKKYKDKIDYQVLIKELNDESKD